MDWVAVENIEKDVLTELKVPFICSVIEKPREGKVCFFAESYLPLLLEKGCILPEDSYIREETDLSHKYMLRCKISVPAQREEKKEEDEYKVLFYDSVNINTIPSEIKARFLGYTKSIASIIGKNIKIGIPHKSKKNAPKSSPTNLFYIFIWSQIEENDIPATVVTPRTMWGYTTSCMDPSFSPSDKGIPIITTENYCVAEVFENALYIHYDICHKDVCTADMIYKKILEEFVNIYKMDSSSKEKYLKEVEIIKRNKTMLDFVNFIGEKNKERIAFYEKLLQEAARIIEDHQREIVCQLGKRGDTEVTLSALKSRLSSFSENSKDEYEKTAKINKVAEIQCKSDHIEIFTKDIYIDEKDISGKNNVIYYIGKFVISIYLDGRIRFFNKTNQGMGPGLTLPKGFNGNISYNRHHPHVNADGIACLGNLSSVIPKYIANCNISVLVTLLIKFLETAYVEDGAGAGIYWWPVVDKKE